MYICSVIPPKNVYESAIIPPKNVWEMTIIPPKNVIRRYYYARKTDLQFLISRTPPIYNKV